MKVVIVGGVAGGATAAARLRRLDENAEIIIIERTHYVSYANCGLPYYIGGTIKDRKKLTLQTPESFRARFEIDVRTSQEVTGIDRTNKQVEILDHATGDTYTETYDKLILSPGAHPVSPNLPGINSSRIFTLRTVENTFAIDEFIADNHAESATIVGGGFIGLEMAENLKDRGLAVNVIQRSSHLMPVLDPDMASLLHNCFRSHGVNLTLNANVVGFEEITDESGRTTLVTRIENNSFAPASDLVILAIGVAPESTLAQEAGLELGMKASIKVDEHLQTSDPDIYAIGDAIETTHVVTGEPAHIALAGPANKQGRIVADHICGINRRFTGSLGSSVMKAFDLTVATTGLTSKAAATAGLDFDTVVLSPASHATYYPGAQSMTMKVLFERPSGRILGAQIIGREGSDKRIDVLAVAIKAGMSAYDLTALDLAYAPPYSSAKDPVNMAGYMIENILEGRVAQVTWDEVLVAAGVSAEQDATPMSANSADTEAAESNNKAGNATIENKRGSQTDGETNTANTVIVDTRTTFEYQCSHIEGAINAPLDDVRAFLDSLSKNKRLFVYCASGLRSYLACRILMQHGFDCANIAGGYQFYEALYKDRNADSEGVGDCGLKA